MVPGQGSTSEIDVPKERPTVLFLRCGSWSTLWGRSTLRCFAMDCFSIKVLRYARAFGAPPPNTDSNDRACIAVEHVQGVKFWLFQSSKRTLQCLFGRWSVEQSDRRPHRKDDTSKKHKTAPVAQLHVQLPFSEAESPCLCQEAPCSNRRFSQKSACFGQSQGGFVRACAVFGSLAATSATGQGRLWPVGWWCGRCTASFGNNPSRPGLTFRAKRRRRAFDMLRRKTINRSGLPGYG